MTMLDDLQNKYGQALLPCPFCGSAPRIDTFHNRTDVTCTCEASPRISSGSPKAAIRVWNTRNKRKTSTLAKDKVWVFMALLMSSETIDKAQLKHLIDYLKFFEGQNVPGIRSPL